MLRLFNVLGQAALLIPLAAGCNQSGPAAPSNQPAAPTVKIVKPSRQTLHRQIEQPGTVRAFYEAPLFVKLPGFARAVHVDIDQEVKGPVLNDKGEVVEPGTLLVEVDIPETVAERDRQRALARQAELDVEHAQKMVAVADAAVTIATATIEEANAGSRKAQANYERLESEAGRSSEMARTKVINPQVDVEKQNEFRAATAAREEARAKATSAAAALVKVKAERELADIEVQRAQQRGLAAKAELQRLEALVDYGSIRAPFDGVVTKRRVDPGHYLQPPSGPNAEPILVVARQDTLRVFVEVTELDAPLVKPGMNCKVRIQSLANREFAGKVTRTSWALHPTTRTLLTEIDLPNKDLTLRPGMYAYGRLEADFADRLVLPATAVQKQGDAMVCYRVVDGKAVRTPVQVGLMEGPWVEVLKKRKPGAAEQWEDFAGDEEVIADSLAAVSDGMPVAK
jgi:RND family efflux transporter MFP subunit